MGYSEVLLVRFHFNGEFVVDGTLVEYCNGDYGVSHIDKDKLSIPELEGHLPDLTTIRRTVRMFWLPLGAPLNSGMRMLVDDKSCLDMLNAVRSDGAVDMYTELIDVDLAAMSVSDGGVDLAAMSESDGGVFDQSAEYENMLRLDAPATHEVAQDGTQVEEEEEADTEYVVIGFTSDEDDEAMEIRTNYKAYMSERNKRQGIPLDSPTSMDPPTGNDTNRDSIIDEDDFGDGIAYFESDEDVSYDNDSDTDAKRRKCRFPIFDSRAETPQFGLDMCFRGKKELKDAIERYALKKKVNIKFPKNDK